VVLTNLTQWITILAVNTSGNIDQLTGNALPSAARDHIILGYVAHVGGAITSIKTQPAIYGDMTYTAYDLSMVFNNLLLSGGRVTQSAAGPLHMDLASGVVWQIGGAPDQVNGPNIVPFVAVPDFSFFPVVGTSAAGASTKIAPVTFYDPLGAGVVTAIPGGATTAAIHRLYYMAGTLIWLYGQTTYTDLATAIANIGIDTQTLKIPSLLNNATLLSLVVAQKNCAAIGDAATCRVVPQGGTNYSIGAAGSISEAPVDGSSYGRKNTAWAKVVDQIVNGDGIAVDNTNPNKPVVSMGPTFAGPKTLTGGNFFLSATSSIFYSKVAMEISAISVDGADNQTIQIAGGGAPSTTRGAFLQLAGNEGGTAGQAQLWSGGGAAVTLGGGNVVIPTGSIFHTPVGAGAGILFSSVDWRINADTVDGADSSRIIISGGGAPVSSRGAFLALTGNEQAGAGVAQLASGLNANVELIPGGTGDTKLTGGRLYGTALHNNATALTGAVNQYVGSGTYTPTITATANVGASAAGVCQWMRVGNVVTVSGRLDVTPTAAAGALTTFQISLPIASNLATFSNCCGAGVYGANPTAASTIQADATTDRAAFAFFATVTTSNALTFQFTYVVL
jgi:hypothetical protein